MTRPRPRFRFVPSGLLLAAALLPACRKKETPPAPPPPAVIVSQPLKADVPVIAEFIGLTEAVASVEVRARVEATIEKIHFTEGTTVKQGDLLFDLDRLPIEQRVAAAKGRVGQLEASLAKANLDVERLAPLAKVGAVPRKDLDAALTAQQAALSALDSGKASLTSAELDLGYTTITAPVAGLIGAREKDVGALVGKGEPTLLATISPLDPIRVSMDISEVAYLNSAERLAGGGESAVFSAILANGATHPHTGRLEFVDRAVNSTTGTIKVRAEFPNPEKILRPGQFVRVRVLVRSLPGALLLPERAISELQGRESVFVVGPDGKVARRSVRTGLRVSPLTVVTEGLTETDRVIVEGIQKARDGAPVQPTDAPVDPRPLEELKAGAPGAAARRP